MLTTFVLNIVMATISQSICAVMIRKTIMLELNLTIDSKKDCSEEHFADVVRFAAQQNSGLNFVIRPHPCADQRWWSNKFGI